MREPAAIINGKKKIQIHRFFMYYNDQRQINNYVYYVH